MIGTSLGPYEIVEQLGKGGMGEVWLAEDTRLGRRVAIKVLPAELAGDADRCIRFEQEAKAAAALNHPNIAAIHDVGLNTDEDPPTRYMVQEYLEGETLRELLERGPLPFEKAMRLAIEIGEGLKAAHRAQIVHRDLKPENIFITPDGHAKILDFGLAKLVEGGMFPNDELSISPTMTVAGQILGTAGYMAPEQVRGEEVNERADLFALGCVLYELITGKRAFGGENVHDTLSRILSREPEPIDEEASGVRLGWSLDKLLAKDPDERYQSAADVVVDLRRSLASGPQVPAPEPREVRAKPRRNPAALIIMAALALALGAVAAWTLKRAPVALAPLDARFEIVLPQDTIFSSNYNRIVTISPDSRFIAYTSIGLRIRPLNDTSIISVPDSQQSRSPAFSSDSRQVAYWESGVIKRASVDGGTPIVVTHLGERPMGMQWADDGYIYVGRADKGIWRAPGSGGELELVLSMDAGEYAFGPELLPGGEWILFTLCRSVRGWSNGSIVAQSLTGDERRVLVPRGRDARYVDSGHLTYVDGGTLFAVPFDIDGMRVDGSAVAMETNLHMSAEDETGAAGYDVSDDGILAFSPPAGYGAAGPTRLLLQDSDGNERPLPIDIRPFGYASLSPDDRRVAAHITEDDGTHVWVLDVDRRSVQRLTSTGRNTYPVWSHDGKTVYFASDRDGDTDIWRRPADLSGPPEKVLAAEGAQLPTAVSQDGQWLYCSWMTPGNSDVARISLTGEPEVEILIEGPADELNARPSADGKFFCYQSDETGRWDVHVTEIATGRRWIVSSEEGYFPFWTRDGKHIMYRVGSQASLSVGVTTEPEFSTTDPIPLFEFDAARQVQMFDITRDGQYALIGAREHQDSNAETRPRVVVDLNWFDKLPERVDGGSR